MNNKSNNVTHNTHVAFKGTPPMKVLLQKGGKNMYKNTVVGLVLTNIL